MLSATPIRSLLLKLQKPDLSCPADCKTPPFFVKVKVLTNHVYYLHFSALLLLLLLLLLIILILLLLLLILLLISLILLLVLDKKSLLPDNTQKN